MSKRLNNIKIFVNEEYYNLYIFGPECLSSVRARRFWCNLFNLPINKTSVVIGIIKHDHEYSKRWSTSEEIMPILFIIRYVLVSTMSFVKLTLIKIER